MRCKFVVPIVLAAMLAFVLPRPAHAADAGQTASDVMSYGTAGTNGLLTVLDILKQPDRTCAMNRNLLSVGVAVAVSEVLKHVVRKARPDGSDYKSFPSEHTAVAEALGGYQFYVGTTLALGTGGLRVAANKHDKIDVAVGLGIGFASQQLGRFVFKCPNNS